MSAAAASAGGDGGEDEARKNDDRKRKEAERSRRRRADKKEKDESDSKKMKFMEVYIAELEKSLESNSVAFAASAASTQGLIAENQRLRNTVLKNDADQASNQSLVAQNQRLLAENTVLKNNTDQSLVAENQRLRAENTVLRNLVLKKNTDQYFDYDRFQSDTHPPSGDAGDAGGSSAV